VYQVIDIGNSYTKVVNFEDDVIKKTLKFENYSNDILQLIKTVKKVDYVIISSVSDYTYNRILPKIKQKTKNIFVFTHKSKTPIINKYKSPETLGLDRLAAIIGANYLYPNKNILVFDAGTALTIDFINDKNEYIGGNISPGIETRFKALNNYTSKLPLLKKSENFSEIGKTTQEAIIAGVQKGIIFEVDAYIEEFKKNYNNLTVIFTGGDSFFFEKNLKNTIFANSNLVSIGLYKVLKFNV
jgi:type III pantothenate kinase